MVNFFISLADVFAQNCCFIERKNELEAQKMCYPVILIRSMKTKILNKDNERKPASEIKNITNLVVVRHSFQFEGSFKIWLKESRSRQFALQIAVFSTSVRPLGPKLCPLKRF